MSDPRAPLRRERVLAWIETRGYPFATNEVPLELFRDGFWSSERGALEGKRKRDLQSLHAAGKIEKPGRLAPWRLVDSTTLPSHSDRDVDGPEQMA